MVNRPEVSQAAAPVEAAHSMALAVQWADVQCSFGLLGESEPFKILK
jgi:hypothetical protein